MLIIYLHPPLTSMHLNVRTAESFPLFNATLNALHRGVKVRLLTNNYEEPLCENMIDPITFLALAGKSSSSHTQTTQIVFDFSLFDLQAQK